MLSTQGYAQSAPKGMVLSGIGDCIKEALATGSVEDNGNSLFLSCHGGKAKMLYNFLDQKVRVEVVQDRNGKFENRAFGNSACYHRVEDQSGKVADDFRCDLVLVIGDVLVN
jgi:hypothetical protein